MLHYRFYATEREKVQGHTHAKGANIEIIAGEWIKEQRLTEPSYDTQLRLKLHKQIAELAREGKSVVEIVRTLNTMKEYSKYENYFVGYAEDHIRKVSNFCKSKTNEDNDYGER